MMPCCMAASATMPARWRGDAMLHPSWGGLLSVAETAVTAGCIIDIGCDMVHAVRPTGPPDDAVLHGSIGYDAGEMMRRCRRIEGGGRC